MSRGAGSLSDDLILALFSTSDFSSVFLADEELVLKENNCCVFGICGKAKALVNLFKIYFCYNCIPDTASDSLCGPLVIRQVYSYSALHIYSVCLYVVDSDADFSRRQQNC